MESQKASAISTLPKPSIIPIPPLFTDRTLKPWPRKTKKGRKLIAYGPCLVAFCQSSDAHPKTAGASKEAKAKKEKEAEAVLVGVHELLHIQNRL